MKFSVRDALEQLSEDIKNSMEKAKNTSNFTSDFNSRYEDVKNKERFISESKVRIRKKEKQVRKLEQVLQEQK
jgi:gamma-glutamyl:cysteine ligase YbdK (ATP-grasp superfamily)